VPVLCCAVLTLPAETLHDSLDICQLLLMVQAAVGAVRCYLALHDICPLSCGAILLVHLCS
jgi:hypothetical protein